MRTIKASEFKAKCLQLMDEVAETGENLLITKRGVPVSVISPYRDRSRSLFGRYRGLMTIHSDVVEPIDETWDVEE